jgi:hypothetical protein
MVPFDINSKIVFTLHQLHRRLQENWLSGGFVYAAMQLYLARIDSDETESEVLRLVDGERSVDQPLVYFSRNKLAAGNYLLFYRCAWKDASFGGAGIGGTGEYDFEETKMEVRTDQMDDVQTHHAG